MTASCAVFYYLKNKIALHRDLTFPTYRKVPLIRPGRIYGRKTNSMGLYLVGGAYIRG